MGGRTMVDKNLVRLYSTSSNTEFTMITSILDDYSVPYIVKDKGAGDYMRLISGGSLFQSTIYVSIHDYIRAKTYLDELLNL